MAEPDDMIIPPLREMRARMEARFDEAAAETAARFEAIDRRFDKLEAQVGTVRQSLAADSLMSKLLTAESDERIEARERRVRELEGLKGAPFKSWGRPLQRRSAAPSSAARSRLAS
jgi:hypothetical protein